MTHEVGMLLGVAGRRRLGALVHEPESSAQSQRFHHPTANEAGRPRPVIPLRVLQAGNASASCAVECRAVVGAFIRAVIGFLRRRARAAEGGWDGRGGAVAIVHRFGGP